MNKCQPRLLLIFIIILLLSACNGEIKSPAEIYHDQTAQQLFVGSEKAIAKGHYKEATQKLEALNALYPFGDYSQQGLLDLIYAYYLNDQSASALAVSDRYIRLYPRSHHVDYAYYMKGYILYTEESNFFSRHWPVDRSQRDSATMRQAFAAFDTLIQLFPTSPYATDARQHMIYIRNVLAQHELEVGEFYYRHKAYVAAANRASDVILHFQGTPQVIPALALSVKANRKLGETQLADNSLRVLQKNFPRSAALKSVQGERI